MFRIYTEFLEIDKKKIKNLANCQRISTSKSQEKHKRPTHVGKEVQLHGQRTVGDVNETSEVRTFHLY